MFIETVDKNQKLLYPYRCIVNPTEKLIFDNGMIVQKYEIHTNADWCAITILSGGTYITRLFLPEGDRVSYNLSDRVWLSGNLPQYSAVCALSRYLLKTPELYRVYHFSKMRSQQS